MRQPPPNDIITVSELNRQVRTLIERNMGSVWLEGEISNLATPASGHIYFSLKDRDAQVRCAMFRGANRSLRFKPANGMAVLVRAKVSLYEARGEFQLVAEHMEEAGEGALRRQFEQLKAKLSAEGLFDNELKQAIPALPTSIGVVTSPSGAAIRDILNILARRFPAIPVTIYPTAVQGDAAVPGITAMLANADGQHDVIILARGGGSLEDLWAFNEEAVARAIVASGTPVISGIGHETDLTIADLVADVRAPTPSGAAELAVPDRADWLRHLDQLTRRTRRSAEQFLSTISRQLRQLDHRLERSSPSAIVQQRAQRIDDLQRRLVQSVGQEIDFYKNKINNLKLILNSNSPVIQIRSQQQQVANLRRRLPIAVSQQLEQKRHRFALQAGKLNAISPLATLDRGYAIISESGSNKILSSVSGVASGQTISGRLSDGELTATVLSVKSGAETD